jgi:cytochrome c oxidase assembly factor CtaG
MRQVSLAWLLLLAARPALAHGAGEHVAGAGWHWEPWVLLLVLAAVVLYLLGWRRLRREGNARRAVGTGRVVAFFAGIATLLAALESPLDGLADQLFSAHMTQHLLLLTVAPPLLVWGRPVFVWLWAFPLPQRRRIGHWWNDTRVLHATHAFLMRPLTVWLLASIALWFWHVPGPYGWALADGRVHVLEHLSFLLTALAFWTLVLQPYGRQQGGHGMALILVATYALHNGLLGALLVFASRPYYPAYATSHFGLTPLEDQQLAGLIMWVPAGMLQLVTLAWLFAGWLGAAGKAAEKRADLHRLSG